MNLSTVQLEASTWAEECFDPTEAFDRSQRNHRFLEEALELVQACGATAEDCHALVDYVFGRPVGDPFQEVGGTLLTLLVLAQANGIDSSRAVNLEMNRAWERIELIRAKHASKPRNSPLPGDYPR